jgi:hypothetical protein
VAAQTKNEGKDESAVASHGPTGRVPSTSQEKRNHVAAEDGVATGGLREVVAQTEETRNMSALVAPLRSSRRVPSSSQEKRNHVAAEGGVATEWRSAGASAEEMMCIFCFVWQKLKVQ